jgi:hypothetical protein
MNLKQKVILSHRPSRKQGEQVINKQDILNLKIALETSKSWEELFSRI